MANQTVAFHGQSAPPVDVVPHDSGRLVAMAQNSLMKTRAVYFYVESRVKGGNGPRCFLTDMSSSFPRRLLCYPLDQTDDAVVRHWAVPRITLIEKEDLDRIDGTEVDQFTYWLLEPKSCFVHISGNPIDLLVSLLAAGANLRWSNAVISYDNESIRKEHQLHIVLYAIEGSPYRLFHLSYPSLRRAILDFCHFVVSDESRLKNIPWSEAQELFDQSLLNWLSDHPVFSAVHLFGRTLEQLPKADA